jgi:ribosomal protein L40E
VILCTNCGFQNEPSATFCGNCGLFLEWVGQHVEDQPADAPPAAVEQPAPEHPERPGIIDRVRSAAGLATESAASAGDRDAGPADAGLSDAASIPPSRGEALTTARTEDVATPPPDERPSPSRSGQPATVARQAQNSARTPPALVRPVPPVPADRGTTRATARGEASAVSTTIELRPDATTPTAQSAADPSARRPVAVPPRPARAKPAPAVVSANRTAKPGDIVCRHCGAANDPARKFCRACGESLAPVAPPASVPWYRRLLTRPRTPALAAGERTPAARTSARRGTGLRVGYVVRSAVGLLFLLGVIGYVAVPPVRVILIQSLRGIVDQARRVVAPRYVIVRPTTETPTSEQPGHEARKAFDQSPKTYWASEDPRPLLTLTFPESVKLGAVSVYSGANPGFVDLRRPATLQLVPDQGDAASIELQDIHTEQKIFFDLAATKHLQVRIVATNGSSTAPLALSELTFFAKE